MPELNKIKRLLKFLIFPVFITGCYSDLVIIHEELRNNAPPKDKNVAEQWECTDSYHDGWWLDDTPNWNNIELIAIVNNDKKSGAITILGTGAQEAVYYIDGIRRRWDFGIDNLHTLYIDPENNGVYFDFKNAPPLPNRNAIRASKTYNCRQRP